MKDAIAWEVCFLLQKRLSETNNPYWLRHRIDRSNSEDVERYWGDWLRVIVGNVLSLVD